MQLHLPTVLAELERLDARLLVVSFAPVERLQRWVPFFTEQLLARGYAERHLTLPDKPFARTDFVANPTLDVYHAYGLGRYNPVGAFSLPVLGQYIRWGLQGRPIGLAGDPLQRGGNFVVGRSGLLTLAHAGRNQGERPAPEAIIAALEQD